MDSSGNVTKNVFNWAAGFGKGVENVSFVPTLPCSFGCQAQGPGKFFQMIEDQDAIIMYPPDNFTTFVGDAIITTEAAPPDTTGGTFRVHFNPVTQLYETTVFDPTFGGTINEGARFVDCDVATPTPTPTSTPTFTPTPSSDIYAYAYSNIYAYAYSDIYAYAFGDVLRQHLHLHQHQHRWRRRFHARPEASKEVNTGGTAPGDISIAYSQFPAPNDNSYGTNAVGWPKGHTFGNLTGSDKAGFQILRPNGTIAVSFNIDYITASTLNSPPSGYRSLGPFGGDGSIVVNSTPALVNNGTPDHVGYLAGEEPEWTCGVGPDPDLADADVLHGWRPNDLHGGHQQRQPAGQLAACRLQPGHCRQLHHPIRRAEGDSIPARRFRTRWTASYNNPEYDLGWSHPDWSDRPGPR